MNTFAEYTRTLSNFFGDGQSVLVMRINAMLEKSMNTRAERIRTVEREVSKGISPDVFHLSTLNFGDMLLVLAAFQQEFHRLLIPFCSLIDPPGSGRFEWIGYYKAVLRQLRDPFLDLRIPSLRTRDFLEAMIEALIQRKPYAAIVDEAQHLAKSEGATTVTEDHLRATAPAEDRVNKWLSEALEGEEELFEKEGADERLLTSLGLRDERKAQKAAETTTPAPEDDSSSHPRRRKRKPGDRDPGRDKTGEHMYEGDDALAGDADESILS